MVGNEMRLYESFLASKIRSSGPLLLTVMADAIGYDRKQRSIATTLSV